MKQFCVLVAAAFLTLMAGQVIAGSDSAEIRRLQSEITKRQTQMKHTINARAAVIPVLDTVAASTLLAEEAITHEAEKRGIHATDEEIAAFMLPVLVQQGLMDPLQQNDFRKDENVKHWLHGQGMSVDQLMRSGKSLVLWTKLATMNTQVTPDEVKQYVEKNPQVRYIPERIRITLATYETPVSSHGRGIIPAEMIAPRVSPMVRAISSQATTPDIDEWSKISLYLDLNQVDPNLREVLSGKKDGEPFGPLLLRSGATIAGTISAFVPGMDLARSPEFWQTVAIRARLEKANQQEMFSRVVDSYLADVSPAVRGFWGKVKGFFKKGAKAIGAVAGGTAGFFAGGPLGAISGARYGYQLGSSVKGWFSSPQQSYADPSGWDQLTSISNIPGADRFQQYLNSAEYAFPGTTNSFRDLRNDFRSAYSDMRKVIPAMSNDYSSMYSRWYDNLPQQPPSMNEWMLPAYMPYPVRSF